MSSSDSDSASSDTAAAADTDLEGVLKGIIVVGGLTGSGDTTLAPTMTTPAPTTTLAAATTPAPAQTAAPATTASPTIPVAPATSIAATTVAPATTGTPATTAPQATTVAPSTAAPTTTTSPSSGFPTTADFFARWNDATAGTNVPTITAGQATELTGADAGYYLITLSPATGDRLPPPVGLLGTLTSPGSGQLATLLLVWIPSADEGRVTSTGTRSVCSRRR